VFSLTAEELEYVRAGLYASVRAETPAVDLPTYGPKIKELAASRQKGQATPERRLRPSAVSGNQPQTEEHKTLYALGLSLGQPLGMFHLTAEDLENVRAGLYASVRAETPAVEIAIYGTKIQMLAVNRSRAQAAIEKEKSKPFLDQAAQERGAVKTGSGLIYKKLRAGKGASPRASDIVRVHYRGTLIDGTEFDSSYKRGEPATFPLDGVIKCWNEGVQRMKTGGKAQLVCPSTLAYGDMGAPPDIKPGATLIFNVELLDVTRKELLEGFQKP
jgi:FKBP-type peptidyl-prolyl cis-trans isomerase FkpA